MNLSTQKRKHSLEDDVGQDRLSEMPDEIILHILSFLPTVDAVRTVSLRRFGTLWTLVPTLMLDFSKSEVWYKRTMGQVYRIIRNLMMFHESTSIDKLHLRVHWYLPYDDLSVNADECDDVRMLLRSALDKGAKEIKLCGIGLSAFGRIKAISHTFSSQFLITLELSRSVIDCQVQVKLGSLKKLKLEHVSMWEESFQQFLRGCPSLQELGIKNPCEILKLSFSDPNIEKLSLALTHVSRADDWGYAYTKENPLLLEVPNIKSLDLEIDRIPIIIINVSSLRDIYFKKFSYKMEYEFECSICKTLLEKFICAEIFQLSISSSEAFLHLVDDLRLLHIRWKRVVLVLRVLCVTCVLGFYQLTRSLTHLEELVIYATTDMGGDSVYPRLCIIEGSTVPVEQSSLYLMPKLRTVTIHCLEKPLNCQLQLIEFLLKSTTVLEKLVVIFSNNVLTEAEELAFVNRVSSFQRASTSARVVFA